VTNRREVPTLGRGRNKTGALLGGLLFLVGNRLAAAVPRRNDVGNSIAAVERARWARGNGRPSAGEGPRAKESRLRERRERDRWAAGPVTAGRERVSRQPRSLRGRRRSVSRSRRPPRATAAPSRHAGCVGVPK
jgi:hypothetical protein